MSEKSSRFKLKLRLFSFKKSKETNKDKNDSKVKQNGDRNPKNHKRTHQDSSHSRAAEPSKRSSEKQHPSIQSAHQSSPDHQTRSQRQITDKMRADWVKRQQAEYQRFEKLKRIADADEHLALKLNDDPVNTMMFSDESVNKSRRQGSEQLPDLSHSSSSDASLAASPLDDSEENVVEDNVPEEFLCPISLSIMRDPVITYVGSTYERKYIEDWLRNHDTDPITNIKLEMRVLIPNNSLRKLIEAWRSKNM